MRALGRVGIFVPKLLGAMAIGNLLFRIVAGLAFNMPDSVDRATRWGLHRVGRDDPALFG